MRSIRSSSRAFTSNERGFALLWAIGLAVLFFLLIELMLIDSARELAEARRFRSRIVAQVLAENGAELAATRILERDSVPPTSTSDWQGKITGTLDRDPNSGRFKITGEGETAGTEPAAAKVEVYGVARNGNVIIEFTLHRP